MDLPFYLDEQLHTHQAIELLNGGELTYQRSFLPVTFPVLLSFKFFGISWLKARLPMIFLNVLSVFPLYLLFNKVNKWLAFAAVGLFLINPWAIAVSRNVREYAVLPLFFYTAALLVYRLGDKQENKKVTFIFAAILAAYLIIFDTRGFLILSLTFYFLGTFFYLIRWKRSGESYIKILSFGGVFVAAFLWLIIRIYNSQKASDLTGNLPIINFNPIFLTSVTQSAEQHSYSLPFFGWILIAIVLINLRSLTKTDLNPAEKIKQLFSANYLLIFIFLSFIIGANGFPVRTRYGIILEILSIPIWISFFHDLFLFLRRKGTPLGVNVFIFLVLAATFFNFRGLNQVYTYKGGPSFSITGINHFRNKEAYEYLNRKLKPGDTVMMDRFYFNNEMYGYQWPEYEWIRANQYLTDNTKSIGEQMPNIEEGWVVLYPEAMADTFGFELGAFESEDYRFKYHGKFGDTYIWHWTKP